MFDLEKQIAVWRQQLSTAGIKAKPSLNELENHLREHIVAQIKSGLSDTQVFEFAVEKIGPIPSLAREFKKFAAAKHAQTRRRAGFAFTCIIAFYSFWVIRGLCLCDLSVSERALGFAAVATLLTLLYAAWRFGPRFFPIIPNRTAQTVLGTVGSISGVIWFAVFVRVVLPRLELDLGPFLVAILWAVLPAILLPATTYLINDKNEYHELTAEA